MLRNRIGLVVLAALVWCGLVPALAAAEKVVFWYRIGAAEFEWIRDELKPRFEAEFPDHELEVVHLSSSRAEADQKILIAVATNQHVDVVRTNPEINLTQYARQGTIVPIDEYAAVSGLDTENYYAAAIDMLTVDGKLYGLPYTALPRPVLWYNDKFFAGSGVEAPSADWTTDDWAAAARNLRVDSDGDGNPEVFGTGYSMSDVEVEMILNGFGGGFLSRDGTESLAGTPESLAGAQFIYDLIYKDNSAPTGDQMEGNLHEMFGSGRVAMNIGNYWNRNFYKAQMGEDDEFKMAPLPAGPMGRFQQYVAGCLSILKSTRSPQAAFEWIKYFTSEEINREYVEKGFNIGTRPAVNQDPQFGDDPFVQQFLPIYEVRPYNLPVWPKNLRRPQYVELVRNAIERMYVLGEQPEDVLPDLDRDITRLLRQRSL